MIYELTYMEELVAEEYGYASIMSNQIRCRVKDCDLVLKIFEDSAVYEEMKSLCGDFKPLFFDTETGEYAYVGTDKGRIMKMKMLGEKG